MGITNERERERDRERERERGRERKNRERQTCVSAACETKALHYLFTRCHHSVFLRASEQLRIAALTARHDEELRR